MGRTPTPTPFPAPGEVTSPSWVSPPGPALSLLASSAACRLWAASPSASGLAGTLLSLRLEQAAEQTHRETDGQRSLRVHRQEASAPELEGDSDLS